MTVLQAALDTLQRLEPREVRGSIVAVRGLSLIVRDLPLPVGALVRIESAIDEHGNHLRGEVVGFAEGGSIVMLFSHAAGVAPGAVVIGEQSAQTLPVGSSLLGRIVNALGEPIDGGGLCVERMPRPLHPRPVGALQRRPINEPLPVGIRAVDAMVTMGKGQRMGVFAGPGVGKSTLLAMAARHSEADVNVIALVGERGREVREFVEQVLGPSGLARSVVVVATSDESPLMRVRAAAAACTMAEFFREVGRDVLLMMDSVTRLAQAQRQIGLTVGELPATKGYTPSVFALLPTILERAGSIEGGGSISALYAVLVEGDDMHEPISDAVRGILDGHITLSRRLAGRGHFPAIDVLDSISRVADQVCDQNHVEARRIVMRLLAAYAEAEELINIGAYADGSNPDCDAALALKLKIDALLQQRSGDHVAYPHTCRMLIELGIEARDQLQQRQAMSRSARASSASATANAARLSTGTATSQRKT